MSESKAQSLPLKSNAFPQSHPHLLPSLQHTPTCLDFSKIQYYEPGQSCSSITVVTRSLGTGSIFPYPLLHYQHYCVGPGT